MKATKKQVMLIFLGFLFTLTIFAQTKNDKTNANKKLFKIYGPDYIVTLSLPKEWTGEQDAGADYKEYAFYFLEKDGKYASQAGIGAEVYKKKEGLSFENFTIIMMSSVANYKPGFTLVNDGSETFKVKEITWNAESYNYLPPSGNNLQRFVCLDCGSDYYLILHFVYSGQNAKLQKKYRKIFDECLYSLEFKNIKEN